MMTKRAAVQPRMQFCTIEDLMPEEHFLRDVYKAMDFNFVYDRVQHLYSSVGRPSIDPVVIVKMLLIGYIYGILSERKLAGEIQVNIAYRWFLGIDLDEAVPDHSTISQLRRRKFNDSRLFEDIFDEVVRKCIDIGLVSGETLVNDSTHIRANAANDKREIVKVKATPSAYMKKLDEAALADGLIKETAKTSTLAKEKTAEQTKSITDPDCGLMNRPGKPTGFHYLNHQTIDANSGIITDVFVTAGNVNDTVSHTERTKYQIEKFGFKTKEIGADAGFDSPEIHAEMLGLDIKTYITERNKKNQFTGQTYSVRDFLYDSENDEYICPNNCRLTFKTFRKGEGQKIYRSKHQDCKSCPLRENCISEKAKAKEVSRPYHKAEYDIQIQNNATTRYGEIQRLRKIWCEGTFAHQKARHGLSRAKMRGIVQTTGQCLLSACAVNLKRMIKWMKGKPTQTQIPLLLILLSVFARLRAFFIGVCQQLRYSDPWLL
jgi:transposase